MLKKTMVALCAAAILIFASPATAFAAPDAPASVTCNGVQDEPYANARTVTSNRSVVNAGDTFIVTWSSGFFEPGAQVTVNVSSQSAPFASGVADSSGSFVASITVPSSVSGLFSVSGVSNGACGGVSVTVTGKQLTTHALPESDQLDTLAFTGANVSLVLLISGSGAVVFGAILLLMRARSRSHLHE